MARITRGWTAYRRFVESRPEGQRKWWTLGTGCSGLIAVAIVWSVAIAVGGAIGLIAPAPTPTATPTPTSAPTANRTATVAAAATAAAVVRATQTARAGERADREAAVKAEAASMPAVTLYCPECAAIGMSVNLWASAGGQETQGNRVVASFPSGTQCRRTGQAAGQFVRVRCNSRNGWVTTSLVR